MSEVKIFVPARIVATQQYAGSCCWLRENLFGSISSSIATLLFFYLCFSYLPPFVDWAFIKANWTGTDRSVCEANAAGAC